MMWKQQYLDSPLPTPLPPTNKIKMGYSFIFAQECFVHSNSESMMGYGSVKFMATKHNVHINKYGAPILVALLFT